MKKCFHVLTISFVFFSGCFQLPACSTASAADTDVTLPETDDGLPGEGPIRRYDWFRKLWLQKRTQFAAEAKAKQQAVVFLGDSITQGWGDSFRGHFAGMHLANRGISGDTTRGMLIRLQEDVLELNPTAVVLLMGTNDLEEHAIPDTIAGNLKLIIDALKQHDSSMPIILCNVFPSSASKQRSADDITRINESYASVTRGDPQITVIDTWTLFADSEGNAKVEEFPDLLHPNDAGYSKWAAALMPVFDTLGLTEVSVDQFELEPGFVSLFNGVDLTGWGFRPTTPEMLRSRERWQRNNPSAPPWPVVTEATDFAGMKASPDGRYVARNGRMIVTTPPEGRKIQQLWTLQEFPQDFTLKLEFRATPNADSGVFIRKPQLQCRDFVLAGPYKDLKNYKAQQWNELTVIVTDGIARCLCNDEVIEAEMEVPQTGPIGLEGDRGQVEYRRIRVRMMP